MNPIVVTEGQPRRSLWRDACGAAIFLSFLVIVAHVAFPSLFGIGIPYSGGAAVVLGAGATVSLALRSRPTRLAISMALSAMLILCALSATRPDLFIAKHGAFSTMDATVMAILGLAAAAMIWSATRRISSEPNKPLQPTGFAGG